MMVLLAALIVVVWALVKPRALLGVRPYAWAALFLVVLALSPILAMNDTLVRPLAKSQYVARTAAGLVIASFSSSFIGLVGFSLTALMLFVVQSIIFLYPASRLKGAALAGGLGFVNSCGLLGGFVGPSVMGLIEQSTPLSRALFHQRQSMSSRMGLALSSITTPFAMAASMTLSASTA